MYRHEWKTLMIGLLLFPMLSGCGPRPGKTANRVNNEQAAAIAEIQKLDGKVSFDEDAVGKPVFAVDFNETHIGDDDLKAIEGLTELKTLILSHTQVTGAALKHIEGLTQLRSLLLHDTRVTDAGLGHIKDLVHLRDLTLDDTQVTDAGLKQLGRLVELKRLGLDGTGITDDGLKQLKGLKALEGLGVLGTKVTPAGCKELKQDLPNLHDIWSNEDGDQPRGKIRGQDLP